PLPSESDHSGWQAYTERVARRSLRFTAHWLLAVSRALQDRAHYQAEPQVFGGDDLVIGSRLDPTTANLGEVARALDRHLERLRDELPRCDVLSFSAGLVSRRPDGPTQTDQQFLETVLQAERWAKWYVKTD